MRASLLLAGVLFVVAVVPGVVAGVPDRNADAVCAQADGPETRIVGSLVESERVFGADQDITVYPGTTIDVVYCIREDAFSPANGSQWSLSDNGIKTSEHDNFYRITVTHDADTISFSSLVDQVDDGFVVHVQHGESVTSNQSGETILFRGDAVRYEHAEQQFVNQTEAVNAHLQRLNETSDSLTSGELPLYPQLNQSMTETLQQLNASYTNATQHGNEAKSVLFNQLTARSAPNSNAILRTMEEVDEQLMDLESRSDDTLKQAETTLQAVRNDARQSILLKLTGGLLAGLIIGGLAGAYGPWSRAKKDAFDRDFGGSNYDRSVLRLPFLVGIVLLCLGLGLAVWTGLAGALL